jgi:hypothetical protein
MQSRVNLHIDFPDMDVEDCVEVRNLLTRIGLCSSAGKTR